MPIASSLPTLSDRVNPWCGALWTHAALHQILAAEDQSGRLRPADALAAAVRDQRRAVLQMTFGIVRISAAASTRIGTPFAFAIGAMAFTLNGLLSAFGPARM